jgi:hypothetical protein
VVRLEAALHAGSLANPRLPITPVFNTHDEVQPGCMNLSPNHLAAPLLFGKSLVVT